ncbi:salicylaldehyde dehydrogenase [Hortaea werneckii]|nr:salicylaldehyde dehydrogenase [Hortaea werneckii]
MARRGADDLLAELDQLGVEDRQGAAAGSQQKSAAKDQTKQTNKESGQEDEDVLADLQAQLAAKPQSSRPGTPRMSSSTTSGTNKSPKRAEHTPASSGPPSGRNSEDRLRSAPAAQPRKSGEETRPYHQSSTPSASEEQQQEKAAASDQTQQQQQQQAGGGWWGSMFSAASAAVKQAESIAKEIRGNEEAQKWAEQVKGNITNLQSFGGELRNRAIPTFTTLLSHIAPPISAHERLQIHATHDIQNYPSLDPLIYSTFSRIMSQVEGGDLLVIQRGSENRPGRTTGESSAAEKGYRGGVLGSGNGWSDGPWWREEGVVRNLSIVPGLKEGSRLARVSAECYAREFFEARGGVEEAAKKAAETLSESNPTRSSDIFLAIQAVSYAADRELFADSQRDEEGDEKKKKDGDGNVVPPEEEPEELVCFAIYLHDPMHSLSFSGVSQPFPAKWASWLDASSTEGGGALPESVREIIESGGVDPREWVAEWVEEILSTSVGVVAQRYVARRMGVGEGQETTSETTFDVVSPFTGEKLWQSYGVSPQQATQAVEKAQQAFKTWRKTKPATRRSILLKAADIFEARRDELAGYMKAETGALDMFAGFNLTGTIENFRDVAGRPANILGSIPQTQADGTGAFVFKEPYGVIYGIAPWNAPYLLGTRAFLYAIAAGNTAVLKGSELCPRTFWAMGDVLKQAGLPDGVLSVIYHRPEDAVAVSNTIIEHPSVLKVNFTGSTAVGSIIASKAGKELKPVLMELGGKASAIVCEDANLERAAMQCALGAFLHAGQICMSTERILVNRKILPQFTEALNAAAAQVYSPEGDAPVLVAPPGVQKNQHLRSDAVQKGAKVAFGSVDDTTKTKETSAHRLRPIIISDVKKEMEIYYAESFGPSVSLIAVDSDEDAIAIANDTEYGLSGAVFTENLGRGLKIAKEVESGAVHINSMTVHDEAALPHGGVRKSGWGRFNAEWGMEEFLKTKTVTYVE